MAATLLLANKGKKEASHEHVIYLRDNSIGWTSTNNGHRHDIAKTVVTKIDVDEQGNEVEVQEEGELAVLPAENGHTHEISEFPIKDLVPYPDFTTKEDYEECYDLLKAGLSLDQDNADNGIIADRYYEGDQWDSSVKSKLKSAHRACLTVNEIKPKIDIMHGVQIQNRKDTKLLANEESDQRLADVYDFRIKNIFTLQNYDYKVSNAFLDALIVGRGVIKVDVNNENELTGNVVIQKRDWKDVFFGEHAESDAKDAEYAGISTWMSLAELKKKYPKKYREISNDFYARDMFAKGESPRFTDYFETYTRATDEELKYQSQNLCDLATKKYRVVEVQRKIYNTSLILFNADDNFYFNLGSIEDKYQSLAEKIEGTTFVVDINYKIRKVILAGSVILYADYSLFDNISIVPMYGNKRGTKFWGKVLEAIDSQNELNKRTSQFIDIINFNTRYNLLFSSEAFEDEKDYQDYLSNCNDPTYMPKLKAGFASEMYQVNGIKYPSEIEGSINISRQNITRIMNVNESMLGFSESQASGIAIAQKIKQGLLGNEIFFDNLSITMKRIAELVVNAIQIIDSPEKLLRLMEANAKSEDVIGMYSELYPELGQEELLEYGKEIGMLTDQSIQEAIILQQQGKNTEEIALIFEEIQKSHDDMVRNQLLAMLNNKDMLKFDVTITESNSAPNTMFSQFVMIQEAQKSGIPIPPELFVNSMPTLTYKQKEKILGYISQQQEQAAQMEQMKYQTELQKTDKASNTKLIVEQMKQQKGTPLG